MKASTIALGIAAAIALYGCGGGGGSNSAVSGPAPAPEETPTDNSDPDTQPAENPDLSPEPAPEPTPEPAEPTPEPEPEPAEPTPEPVEPTPEPVEPDTGAGFDMGAPFNQQLDCKYGIKPYYDTATSGIWTVAFDGNNFSLQSGNALQQFGGSFANSGNAVEREDFGGSSLQRTYLGATGGEIYFTKTIPGVVIAAGHNNFGGNNPRADTVECGTTDQWIPTPSEPSPFAGTDVVTFAGGTIEMHCALRQGEQAYNEPVQTRVITGANGSLEMLVGGRSNLFETDNFNGADRTVGNPVNSATLAPGGVRVYTSQDNAGNTIEINLRTDNLVRHIREIRADGLQTRCVPYPLDPRSF